MKRVSIIMQKIKINFLYYLHKLNSYKYYLLFAIIVSIIAYDKILSMYNSSYYTINGTKDQQIHKATYVAIYEASNDSGFNCKTLGISDAGPLPKTLTKYNTIEDNKYNIRIPYKLSFYEDLSIGCEFKLTKIQLVVQQHGEHDYKFATDSRDEEKAIPIFSNIDYSNSGVEKFGWAYNIKHLKKYFKIPPNTKLYCHTEASELLCELEAPKGEYTYYYETQNQEKVVSYITHPDIGTDRINELELFNIDILMYSAVPYSKI